ncbi:hypothetical protein GCM10018965_038750 [Nonomuraea roseola]
MKPAAVWVRSEPALRYEHVDDPGLRPGHRGSLPGEWEWTNVWGSNGFCGGAYSAYLDEIGWPSV